MPLQPEGGVDWAHIFLSILPALPLNVAQQDESRVGAALRAAAAAVIGKHAAALRHAAVAEWCVRLRCPGGAPAWRVVVSLPSGAFTSILECLHTWLPCCRPGLLLDLNVYCVCKSCKANAPPSSL